MPLQILSMALVFLILGVAPTPGVLPQEAARRMVWPYGGRITSDKDAPVAHFDSTAYFLGTQFGSAALFDFTQFHGAAYFNGAQFDGGAQFASARFDSTVNFWSAHFGGSALFMEARFDTLADFYRAQFDTTAYFHRAHFGGVARFSLAQFDKATFSLAQFDSSADFSGARFGSEVSFNKTRFGGRVDFTYSEFKDGLDLRESYLGMADKILLEGMAFPDGQLRVYWHQLKGNEQLRLQVEGEDSQDESNLTTILYHRLRDNYKAQGDLESADEVMYELGWQQEEILGEWKQILYGWFFGYGYRPWRFLAFAVLPAILGFSMLWHQVYYPTVLAVIDRDNAMILEYESRESGMAQCKKQINWILRYWHVAIFSASVLLGVRFKREWVTVKPRYGPVSLGFTYWVTAEWTLGIVMYVLFAVLVKGHRFEYVKGLLGF